MTRTERTYYAIFGLYSLPAWFMGPVYPLFLLSRGLDLFQINVVLATFLITSCLLEVPTGAFADVVGRKTSFLLSCAVRTLAFALYAFTHNFTDCLIAEFIDAIGSTLANGALDAWAVDGMRAEGNRGSADRFFARAQMIARALMIVGGIACGYIAEYRMELPWLVAAGGFALTGVVSAVLMDEKRPSTAARARWTNVYRSLGQTVRDGMTTVRNVPVLLLLCGLSMAAAFGSIPAHMLWQARLQALTGAGLWLMGWLWSLLNLAAIVGSALVGRLLRRFGREQVLGAAALGRGMMLAVAALATSVFPVLTGLLLLEAGFGLSEPLVQALFNEHIPPEQRATVLSVRSMFFTLGGGAGLLSIGLVARGFGIPAAWLVSATVLTLVAPGFVLLSQLVHRTPGSSAHLEVTPTPAKVSPPALG